ncbi:bifunctional UDP-N-acetylglucosamine diphosphorylase/glucosamine-1-phosphate N-acetyltransferase GlmU [Pelagibaculum spongiae]|uniref:Bifunctional protein GlmU n=1 Tax=Pelagibaculum spongiae TaxID=2080658 RepID=A0A2V1GVH4_9GAMM|nr:bifunctional UDP-N-acetylglucosamine diphosphorylase/glucosamine-1-phosphate N-acetyltransferase GlmU [Pelagibaculum spongiae]PVZ68341.1 UDP-N-acetylglucosamine diphosphorylase/glucosamine-1-phosphate N-acetyltransferase [Pelagibaculum spongiae]
MTLAAAILAAGQGTRMRSSLPKVLHPLANKPMVQHVIDAAKKIGAKDIHLVYGHGAEMLQQQLQSQPVNWVQQAEQLGTGHAVMQVLPSLADASQLLVLYGDVPLIQPETLQQLLAATPENGLALLTVQLNNPTGYGRIIRNPQGAVLGIVEQKDASAEQLAICEGNSGIMCIDAEFAKSALPQLSNSNAQQEYYLTDLVAMAVAENRPVHAVIASNAAEVSGANDRVQLAALERVYQSWQAEKLMRNGASLADPARIDIRGEVTTGQDCKIDINVIFEGKVTLGDRVEIAANCILKDCSIADDTIIKANSMIEDSQIAQACEIGPFARLRPGTQMDAKAKIGNFVETKKTRVGQGSKINHLSYVGDAELAEGVNIGAGTITCNYDGVNKFKTQIAANAFIGSNTSLVAPVSVAENATVAAGSVITKKVEAGQLAIARGKQKNLDNWQRPVKK